MLGDHSVDQQIKNRTKTQHCPGRETNPPPEFESESVWLSKEQKRFCHFGNLVQCGEQQKMLKYFTKYMQQIREKKRNNK